MECTSARPDLLVSPSARFECAYQPLAQLEDLEPCELPIDVVGQDSYLGGHNANQIEVAFANHVNRWTWPDQEYVASMATPTHVPPVYWPNASTAVSYTLYGQLQPGRRLQSEGKLRLQLDLDRRSERVQRQARLRCRPIQQSGAAGNLACRPRWRQCRGGNLEAALCHLLSGFPDATGSAASATSGRRRAGRARARAGGRRGSSTARRDRA